MQANLGEDSTPRHELCANAKVATTAMLDDVLPHYFSQHALNTTTAAPVLDCAATRREGPTALDGWMIPRAVWLTPDPVSQAAECRPNFWSLGPFDVPSAKLDALAIKATANIDRFDPIK